MPRAGLTEGFLTTQITTGVFSACPESQKAFQNWLVVLACVCFLRAAFPLLINRQEAVLVVPFCCTQASC